MTFFRWNFGFLNTIFVSDIMPVSQFLVSSLQNRAKVCLNLCRGSGPFRTLQSHSYTGSPKYNYKKPSSQRLLPEKPLSSHSQSTYIIPTALLLVAGAGLLFHFNDERRAILKGQETRHERDTTEGPKIGGPFTLIDTEHQLVTERKFLGDWVLLYFGYTSSPDIGPEEVQKMAKAIEILESKHNLKIVPVFVTIDPQRDSPSQLGAYLKEFDSRIIGLTGRVASVRQMAQEYRVYFKKVEEEGDDYIIESSHNMYLLGPNMESAKCFGTEYDAEQLAEAILKEVKKASKQMDPNPQCQS